MTFLDSIPTTTQKKLDEFKRIIRQEEAAIGDLNERMKVLPMDTQAGREEWYKLFQQIALHTDKIEEAFKNL